MKTEKLLNYLFYFSVLVFFIGFNFRDNPQGGWQLQTMPNLNGATIKDIDFVDSLTGFAVTNYVNSAAYILKTTNGGDNWSINYTHNQSFWSLMFINTDTGFATSFDQLFRTTNSGENWNIISLPEITGEDMYVLNTDTIWLVETTPLTGGVFRTTNGGLNWTQQLAAGSQNPDKIYMYNSRIGFIVRNSAGTYNLRKTTDGGFTWFTVLNSGFYDMYFLDSLIGWRSWGANMFKTTDGGLSWFPQPLPQGGNIITSTILDFECINQDTVWGVGGWVYYPTSGSRGMIYRTTNSGNNWYYQVPDTSINIFRYNYLDFIGKLNAWAYFTGSGIHTTTGGDSNFVTSIKNNSISKLPDKYKLYQNYPNPFNSNTNIEFQMLIPGFSKIKLYDISGKEVKTLINESKPAGTYSVRFDSGSLTSGIYFYSLIVDGIVVETKKAILVK